MANKLAHSVDTLLMRHFGARYALITRDWMINERMRFLVDWIGHEAGLRSVLDVGCGSGLALPYLYWYQRNKISFYLGLDLDTERLRTRYQFVGIPHSFKDIDLDLSWQFGSFDIVFCSEVLEHLSADSRLFSRLCRHLSENGTLLVTTPHKEFVRRNAADFPGFDAIRPTQDGGHVRMGYLPSELEEMAYANGLAVAGKAWLGEMNRAELSGRETKRKQGDYQNMIRYNFHWIRRMNRSKPREPDRCWTLAMAFKRPTATTSGRISLATA
jgi:SAM-dependent methyltransferase